MHCEVIDRYFNAFCVEIQLEKENLKSVFWATEFGCPNWYTDLPNDLTMSLARQKNYSQTSPLKTDTK